MTVTSVLWQLFQNPFETSLGFFLSSHFYFFFNSAFSEEKDRQIKWFWWFLMVHSHISDKSICASAFARNGAPEAEHNRAGPCRAGTGGTSSPLPSRAASHPPSHPELSLLSPREHTERCQISPLKSLWPHHEPLQYSLLVFCSLRAGIIPFYVTFCHSFPVPNLSGHQPWLHLDHPPKFWALPHCERMRQPRAEYACCL